MTAGEPLLHVALLHPEIPGNTGNIGRLCLGYGVRLHLVHPLGFRTDERAARRAGIDHWRHVDRVEHDDEAAFLRWAAGRRVHAFSARAGRPHTALPWRRGDVALFGPESTGLPDRFLARYGCWRVPLPGPVRSLNLANAVAIVVHQAAWRLRPELFEDPG